MNPHVALVSLALFALGCRSTHTQTTPRVATQGCRTLPESARVHTSPRPWTRSTHAHAITAPAVLRTCEAIATETRAQLRGITTRPTVLDFSGLGRCANAGRGAWILAAEAQSAEASAEDPPNITGEWRAVYIDERGARVEPRERRSDAEQPPGRGLIERSSMGASAAEIMLVHDIDGDGVGELVVARTNWDAEGSAAPRHAIYTAHASIVSGFAATDVERFTLVDIDDDQRIDLQIDGEFYITTFIGMDSDGASGPSRVLHGLADATFSRTDDSALALRLAQCPRPPARIVVASASNPARIDETKLITNIACARSWGASAADVLTRARAEWLATDDNETMREHLEEAVAIEPALSLRGLCPIEGPLSAAARE